MSDDETTGIVGADGEGEQYSVPQVEDSKKRKRSNGAEGFERPIPWVIDAFRGHLCPICLDPTEHSAMVQSCRHVFCGSCLFKWLEASDRCPLCKGRATQVLHDIKSPREYKLRVFSGRPGGAGSASTLSRAEGSSSPRGAEFRSIVYRRNLAAEPPVDKARRPKSVEQLRSWIAREIQVAAGDGRGRSDTRLVVDFVEALLKEYDMDDQDQFCKVKEQLQGFLFENTDPFLHELWCFRWSRLGMTAYDRDTVYSARPA